jgi:hypothetical protein
MTPTLFRQHNPTVARCEDEVRGIDLIAAHRNCGHGTRSEIGAIGRYAAETLAGSDLPNVILNYTYDGVGNVRSLAETIDSVAAGVTRVSSPNTSA